MKVYEIFNSLASGELHTLNVVSNGEINPDKYARVIQIINRGLVALSTRFMLKKKTVTLTTTLAQYVYALDEMNLQNINPNGYLQDTNEQPFTDKEFLEILEILDEKQCSIPLDGSGDFYRSAIDILCFRPGKAREGKFEIEYKALLPLIHFNPLDDIDILEVDVELPLAYLNALVYYVAGALHQPTLSTLDGPRASLDTNYRQLYEAECALLLSQGVDVDEYRDMNQFHQRGFI